MTTTESSSSGVLSDKKYRKFIIGLSTTTKTSTPKLGFLSVVENREIAFERLVDLDGT
jgi:hypothetical protein